MLKKLPVYKGLVLRCIESCVTSEQLDVAFEFIELFRKRYQGWLDPHELYKHYSDLQDAYLRKTALILIN